MEDRGIKFIDHHYVHKICSGQVVLSLATAVKELVENSIDAGATIIDIKLKEYGSEFIEVIDNGRGVKSSDYQSITLKHHTSKIKEFQDVQFVSTFGFRGEALSSLCALSDVEIITRHCDSSVGTMLIYDHDGLLVKQAPTHRQVGTTVILKNLFFTVPVRQKEFHRNIRREYLKMLQILTAYCLISIKKKISCMNVTEKRRKTIVISSNCCDSYKDNVSFIFGQKQVDSLIEFVQILPPLSVLEDYFLPPTVLEKSNMFRIEGFISSSCHGEGRSSMDRQFFYINGRPCDLPKVSKLINDVYHSFNKSQYPFVFLNINVTEGFADINVVPDKRHIFLSEEKLLMCIIKASLHHMYHSQLSQMKIASDILLFQRNMPDTHTDISNDELINKNEEVTVYQPIDEQNSNFEEKPLLSPNDNRIVNLILASSDDTVKNVKHPEKLQKEHKRNSSVFVTNTNLPCTSISYVKVQNPFNKNFSKVDDNQQLNETAWNVVKDSTVQRKIKVLVDKLLPRKKKIKTVTFRMREIKKEIGNERKYEMKIASNIRKFKSKIVPVENNFAEAELKREIKQDDFSKMIVIGQFNLGFIITRLNDDLFIIDQHATDEKYHFETLRRLSVLETQQLLNPLALNLTAASETILIDNLHILEKNGFRFDIDGNSSVGSKVQLTSVPVSHNWSFGKEDIDEIIFMLADNPVSMVRPSRINQMFATRACRNSVMIGTALPIHTMKKLVLHMGEMEQPWNCPHGRPTMRHLLNLTLLKRKEDCQ